MKVDSRLATGSEYEEPQSHAVYRGAGHRADADAPRAKRGIPPQDRQNRDGPTSTSPQDGSHKNGPDKIEYIGGVQVKTGYTLEEVLNIAKEALAHPVGSFAASSADMRHVLLRGRNITGKERAEIMEDTSQADSFLVGVRSFHPVGGAMNVATVNADALHTMEEGKPLTLDQMDTMLFSVNELPSKESVAVSIKSTTTASSTNHPSFKPPTRLEDGRVGYPSSPTRPPRLPPDKAGGSVASTSRPRPDSPTTGDIHAPRPSTSTDSRHMTPASKRKDRAHSQFSSLKARIKARFSSDANRVRNGDIAALENKGAIYLREASEIATSFDYFRYDKDVKMVAPAKSSDLIPEVEREVLRTGNGKQITSLRSDARVYFGSWGRNNRKLSAKTDVIELENGKQGVGAVRISFADIPPKKSVLVITGDLSGCTVMFAADNQHFYAYHSGISTPVDSWKTAREGVRDLRAAHEMLKPGAQRKRLENPENNDLVDVANSYDFSVIVYNGKFSRDAAGVDARITRTEQERAEGTNVHSYFDANEGAPSIGTAFALIRKDAQGHVSISTLYERGELTRAKSTVDPTRRIMYDYEAKDTQIDKFVP